MNFPDNIQDLGTAAQTFMMTHGASLSEELRNTLLEAISAPSPVDRIVKTGEALYAARATLNDDGKTLCAQLISFASLQGWHGLGDDNRGGRIVQAIRRDLGEKAPSGKWPAADTDPEPDNRYITTVEAAVEAPPASLPA